MPPTTASERLEPSSAPGARVLRVLTWLLAVRSRLAVLARLAVVGGLTVLARLAVLGRLAVLAGWRVGRLAVFGGLLAVLLGRRVLLRRRVRRLRRLGGLLVLRVLLRRVGRRLPRRRVGGRLVGSRRRRLPRLVLDGSPVGWSLPGSGC